MKKSGKKVKYIDVNNFVDQISDSFMNPDSLAPANVDPIRYFSKNIWSRKNRKLLPAKQISDKKVFDVEVKPNGVLLLKGDKSLFYTTYFENGLLRKEYTDISANNWESYISSIIPNKNTIFEDTYIEFSEPAVLNEVDSPQSNNLNYVNSEFIYNFYSPKYESLINNSTFRIKTLPTAFGLIEDPRLGTRTEQENLVLSLGGLLPQNEVSKLYFAKTPEQAQDYFDKYADVYQLPEAVPVINKINSINTILNISKSKTNLAKYFLKNLAPFPFYTYLEFSNESPSKDDLIHILSENNNIEESLLAFLQGRLTSPIKNFVYESESIEQKQIPYTELKNWFNSVLGTNNGSDANVSMTDVVSHTKVLDYINKYVSVQSRTYDKFTSSSQYHTLFYKIEKRQFNHTSPIIQTFYVTPDESEIIKFFDTQIKYGTEYFYTIKSIVLVVGTKYSYTPYEYKNSLEKIIDKLECQYKVNVATSPTHKLLEMPLAYFNGAAVESPCTAPELLIREDSGKVRFDFKDSPLTTLEEFNAIENGEFEIFDLIRRSQMNNDVDKIKSKISDSTTKKVQIYRITDFPNSYLSFQGKLYKTITLDTNKKSFIDSLLDNVTYYYMFRHLNEHNVPSNTSDIYKIVIKNEEDYRYINVDKIDLEIPYAKKDTKNMRRYMLIRPSIIQTQPKYGEEVATVNDIDLGPQESVWNKRFLIKLTSKKTNRVIELRYLPRIVRKNNNPV